MNLELSPKERATKITEILAEGVLALIRSLPLIYNFSRIKVSESVKMRIVPVSGSNL